MQSSSLRRMFPKLIFAIAALAIGLFYAGNDTSFTRRRSAETFGATTFVQYVRPVRRHRRRGRHLCRRTGQPGHQRHRRCHHQADDRRLPTPTSDPWSPARRRRPSWPPAPVTPASGRHPPGARRHHGPAHFDEHAGSPQRRPATATFPVAIRMMNATVDLATQINPATQAQASAEGTLRNMIRDDGGDPAALPGGPGDRPGRRASRFGQPVPRLPQGDLRPRLHRLRR